MASLSTKPRWTIEGERRRGKDAHDLAVQDRAAIEGRLDAGRIEGIAADLVAIAAAPVGAQTDLIDQKAATGGERATAKDGHDMVMLARESAQRKAPGDLALLRGLGVGDSLRSSDTNGIVTVLQKLVELAGPQGTGLVHISIQPSDVKEAEKIASDLGGKDATQLQEMSDRKRGTESRTDLRLRVEAAVDDIAMAGQWAFRKDAAKRSRYEKLLAYVPEEAEPSKDEGGKPGSGPA